MRVFGTLFVLVVAEVVMRCPTQGHWGHRHGEFHNYLPTIEQIVRSTETKLDQHEVQQQVLGNHIKTTLTTIDQRQQLLPPMRDILGRIEQRLAAVEATLKQNYERERTQFEITNTLVAQIQQNLPNMFEKLKNEILVQKADIQACTKNSFLKTDVDKLKKNIESKIDAVRQEVVNNVDQVRDELQKQKTNVDQILTNVNTIAAKVPKIAEVSDIHSVKNEVFNVLELNHAKLHKTLEDLDSAKSKNDLQPKILQIMEQQKTNSDNILATVKSLSDKVPTMIVQPSDLQVVKSEVVSSLDQINTQLVHIQEKIEEQQKSSEQNSGKLQNAIESTIDIYTKNNLQPRILQVVEQQGPNIDQILSIVKNVVSNIPDNIAQSSDVQNTMKLVEQIKTDFEQRTAAITDTKNSAEQDSTKIFQAIGLQATRLDQLSNNIQALSQVDNQCALNTNLTNQQLQEIQAIAKQNNAGVYKILESLTQKDLHLQPSILQGIEIQQKNVEQILSKITAISEATQHLPNSEIIKNETLQSLQQIKDELREQGASVTNKISVLQVLSEKHNENLQKSIVEFGDVCKVDYKELNSTINTRFDKYELSLLQPENGALANLSSYLASKVDQVWHQIGIMHQQMGDNTVTLEKMKTQRDTYINGLFTIMHKMCGEVMQGTKNIADNDNNLNSLLGCLSAVTQEFNRIKSTLGEVLEQVKKINAPLNDVPVPPVY